jgi:hypothetical protein
MAIKYLLPPASCAAIIQLCIPLYIAWNKLTILSLKYKTMLSIAPRLWRSRKHVSFTAAVWDFHSKKSMIFRKKSESSWIFYLFVTVQPCIFLPAVSGQEASGVRPMKI